MGILKWLLSCIVMVAHLFVNIQLAVFKELLFHALEGLFSKPFLTPKIVSLNTIICTLQFPH
jgi:hypothetical protein